MKEIQVYLQVVGHRIEEYQVEGHVSRTQHNLILVVSGGHVYHIYIYIWCVHIYIWTQTRMHQIDHHIVLGNGRWHTIDCAYQVIVTSGSTCPNDSASRWYMAKAHNTILDRRGDPLAWINTKHVHTYVIISILAKPRFARRICRGELIQSPNRCIFHADILNRVRRRHKILAN